MLRKNIKFSLVNVLVLLCLSTSAFAQEQLHSAEHRSNLFRELEESKDIAETYVKKLGGLNFIQAKRAFYAKIPFSMKEQEYKNFNQPSEWKSLNHPPIKELLKELSFYDESFQPIDYSQLDSPYFSQTFHKDIDEVSKSQLSFGNKLTLLSNGLSYSTKIDHIRGAKESIEIAVMSFFCDESSDVIANELIKKIKDDNVRVKMIVEKIWTKIAMKKCLKKLRNGGVEVVLATDLLKRGDKQSLFHNKFWIFDNKTAIVGGMNVINSDNLSTGFNETNRDTDLLINGPLVTDVMESFNALWKKFKKKPTSEDEKEMDQNEELVAVRKYKEQQEQLRGSENYEDVLSDPSKRMNGVCRFVRQGTDIGKDLISKAYASYMAESQSSMYLISQKLRFPAEFEKKKKKPKNSDAYWGEIFKAADRNVKVVVISNGIDGKNGELTHILRDIQERKVRLNRPGAKLFGWINGLFDKSIATWNLPYLMHIDRHPSMEAWTYFQFIHSKIVYIDRLVTSIGSFNLEDYSANNSHESTVICQDESLNKEMDSQTVMDKINSTPVPQDDALTE